MTQDNTPPSPISKLDYSTTKRTHRRKDTFAESSRLDGFNAAVFGPATVAAVEKSSFENRSRGYVILCHIRAMPSDQSGGNDIERGEKKLTSARTVHRTNSRVQTSETD